MCAKASASMASVLARRPMLRANSRAARGLTTATANPWRNRKHAKRRSQPPVASSTIKPMRRSWSAISNASNPLSWFGRRCVPGSPCTAQSKDCCAMSTPMNWSCCDIDSREVAFVISLPCIMRTRVRVTVRAWRQTQAPARLHARGRALSSEGGRAVQALAKRTATSA